MDLGAAVVWDTLLVTQKGTLTRWTRINTQCKCSTSSSKILWCLTSSTFLCGQPANQVTPMFRRHQAERPKKQAWSSKVLRITTVSDLFNDMIRTSSSLTLILLSIPRNSDNPYHMQQEMPPTTPESMKSQSFHTWDTTPGSQSMRNSAQHQQYVHIKTQASTYQNLTPWANSPEKHSLTLTMVTFKIIHNQRRCFRSAQSNKRTNSKDQTPCSQSFGSCSWYRVNMMSCWGLSCKISQTS
jgi:hypothetical protein